MITLSKFLANYLLDRKNFDECEWPLMLKEYTELVAQGVKKYKEHLKNDRPKTVQWAMIEKKLITALEQMESHKIHLHSCAAPELRANFGCTGCKQSDCQFREEPKAIDIKHPICPLNMYFEGDEHKFDPSKCNFKERSCTQACKIEINEAGFHEADN